MLLPYDISHGVTPNNMANVISSSSEVYQTE